MIDISANVEPGEMPLCPLCDNEILEWEPAVLVSAHGSKAIAHVCCADNSIEDEE